MKVPGYPTTTACLLSCGRTAMVSTPNAQYFVSRLTRDSFSAVDTINETSTRLKPFMKSSSYREGVACGLLNIADYEQRKVDKCVASEQPVCVGLEIYTLDVFLAQFLGRHVPLHDRRC